MVMAGMKRRCLATAHADWTWVPMVILDQGANGIWEMLISKRSNWSDRPSAGLWKQHHDTGCFASCLIKECSLVMVDAWG